MGCPCADAWSMGRAEVSLEPLGVVAAIIPWNSTLGFSASKVATAIAAGSTIVLKPSEMSAIQTRLWRKRFMRRVPKGVINLFVAGATAVSCHQPDADCARGELRAGALCRPYRNDLHGINADDSPVFPGDLLVACPQSLPVFRSAGKQLGKVVAEGIDADDQPVIVAEVERPLGIAPRLAAIPTYMLVQRPDRIVLTINAEEVANRLFRAQP